MTALLTTNRSKVPAARALKGLTEADRIQKQIIGILREQEAGTTTAHVCRKHRIRSATFYKWKAKYVGLEVSDAKRLKLLEEERQAQEAIGRGDLG
ncbi:endonuclease III-like uncharacterized protein [Bradyrhizobium japonicum]